MIIFIYKYIAIVILAIIIPGLYGLSILWGDTQSYYNTFIIVVEESFTHPMSSGGDKTEVRNNLSSEY